MSRKKHDWNTWENYLKVHERVLKDFDANIVTQTPRYKVDKVTPNYYTLEISRLEILTANGNKIFVKIEKDIVVKAGGTKDVAKLFNYSYHAWQSNPPKNLLRYCGPHDDHNKFHHRHDYTVSPMITTKIKDDEFPHVSEFLQEVIDSF